jgi:hypothetical protein
MVMEEKLLVDILSYADTIEAVFYESLSMSIILANFRIPCGNFLYTVF